MLFMPNLPSEMLGCIEKNIERALDSQRESFKEMVEENKYYLPYFTASGHESGGSNVVDADFLLQKLT